MTCAKCDNGNYDVGVSKIEVIVAIPPVEVYLKIKDERITDEIKINVAETKQIKVVHFCFATTSSCNWYRFRLIGRDVHLYSIKW